MLASVMGAFRRRLRGSNAMVAALAALVVALAVPAGSLLAAAPNALVNPSVSPRSGTTTTSFAFSVDYVGRWDASAVSVLVGSTTISLALVDGVASHGTFAGSSRLPAGTWSVTFSSVTVQGNAPSISAGQVTVTDRTTASQTPAPTATPRAPAPTSTPKPTSGTTGGGTTGGGTAATPVSTPSPTGAASGELPTAPSTVPAGADTQQSPDGDGAAGLRGAVLDSVPPVLLPLLFGGFVLIATLVALWLVAARRNQRRAAIAAAAAAAAEEASRAKPNAKPPKRRPSFWEVDAGLDDAPIGTVEFPPAQRRVTGDS